MNVLGNPPVTHTYKIHEAVGPAVRNVFRVTPTQRRKNYTYLKNIIFMVLKTRNRYS